MWRTPGAGSLQRFLYEVAVARLPRLVGRLLGNGFADRQRRLGTIVGTCLARGLGDRGERSEEVERDACITSGVAPDLGERLEVMSSRSSSGTTGPRLSVGVVLGQDPQRLGMVGDDAATDLRDLLAQLLGRQEAQLAAGELLDEHAGAGRVAVRFVLAWDRDDVA